MELQVTHDELTRMEHELKILETLITQNKCEVNMSTSKGQVKDILTETKQDLEKIGAAVGEVVSKTAQIVAYMNKEFKTMDTQTAEKILR